MNHSSLNLERSSHGGGDFFYSNLRLQEMRATIRYGIEARKGLIILTGESGIGKTIHLQKIATELASNVTCILESDPRMSFADILRVILGKLNCAISDLNEPALIQACRDELRARSERCQIVALLFDNAHHLPDQTIHQIIQNFIGNRDEDTAAPPLQLVLAGRPELRAKLSHTALIPLRRRRPIMCELKPLSSGEIGSYIQARLSSGDRQQDLFNDRAIKRIALYTHGNPRAVNALYDRTLQITGEGNVVTPELVDGAARDLDLHASEISSNRAQALDQSSEFAFDGDVPDTVKPAFPARYEDCGDEPRRTVPSKKISISTSLWALLIVLGGAAFMVSAGRPVSLLEDWSARLTQIAASVFHQQPHSPSEQPNTRIQPLVKTDSPIRVTGPDFPTAPQKNETTEAPLARNSAQVTSEVTKSGQGRRIPSKEKSPPVNPDIQTQVTKAIESRAIMGVEVTVVRGTAFLDGHVATERQRRAAESAARSVAGVERVRNRIAITFG